MAVGQADNDVVFVADHVLKTTQQNIASAVLAACASRSMHRRSAQAQMAQESPQRPCALAVDSHLCTGVVGETSTQASAHVTMT